MMTFDGIEVPSNYVKSKCILLYSGGKGSFNTACFLLSKNIPTYYYFNDTFYEHDSLYTYLNNTLAWLHNKPVLKAYDSIPSLVLEEDNLSERRDYLTQEGKKLQKYYPNFIYDPASTSLHELFIKRKFMANSRVDICSQVLKREQSSKFIKKHFFAELTSVAVGIGMWESHRLDKARPNWSPYDLISPYANFLLDDNIYDCTKTLDLELPYLYTIGASHNNCSGFCVKAGLAHYRQLLKNDRDLYLIHENNEQLVIKLTEEKGRKVKPFLSKQINGKKIYLTLKDFRLSIENNSLTKEDMIDETFGSCSCAI